MSQALDIVHEDDAVVIINKPAGLLSQPGKTVHDSAETRLRDTLPDLTGPVVVHRLDMDTSGLMVFARHRAAHRHLQQQFEQRHIAKRYVAEIEGEPDGMGGCITLPLRVDLDDRPRQIVCWQHGKSAYTAWRVINEKPVGTPADARSIARIELLPHTGRTHQLRVHMAHPLGLNCPIVGDRLYGTAGERMRLHACLLGFHHPESGDACQFQSLPDF